MIGWLNDQSRHRAAKDWPRHQKRTVEIAATGFRCVIERKARPGVCPRSSHPGSVDAGNRGMALGVSAGRAGV